MITALLLRFWKETAVVVLLASLITVAVRARIERDGAFLARGKAVERARVADSILVATKAPSARVDTLLVRDTVTVRRTLVRLDTLRAAVLAHPTDTVIIKEFARAADSTAVACSELAGDCAEFRRLANVRFAAYEAKIANVPTPPPKSCTVSNVLVGGLGIAGGFLIGRR